MRTYKNVEIETERRGDRERSGVVGGRGTMHEINVRVGDSVAPGKKEFGSLALFPPAFTNFHLFLEFFSLFAALSSKIDLGLFYEFHLLPRRNRSFRFVRGAFRLMSLDYFLFFYFWWES